jgi:Asp-tRNA(Asn)/Glu-tRNA(Gln) amidotransferase A subunit family amidase
MQLAPAAAGRLSGFSISIKDSLDIAGFATVCGSASRTNVVAQEDAVCVQRLRAAGATIIGKTNVPEFLMNWDTFNEVYGVTRNPWNLEMSPGGSSGGEAAAIAAGLSRAGIGSDGGGSIRLPAALCGIVGLKPTPGRVPATGHFPKIAHPGGLLGVIGPMARTVADTKAVFEVVSGHHPSDPFSAPVNALPFPSDPRIGLLEESLTAGKKDLLPFPAATFPAFPWERAYAIWEFFFLRLNAHPLGKPTPHTAKFLELPPPTAEDILNMLAARDALRARLLALMEDFPFLLAPVFKGEPWRCGEFPGPHVAAPLTYANLFGLPALSLPIEVRNGMPHAWQLIGRPWEEEALLELAAQIELRRGPFPAPALANLEVT